MSRTAVALLAALEAAIATLVGLGVVLVPLMLLWAVHFGLTLDASIFLRATADVWLLGHGVDLTVQLDPLTAELTGVAGAGDPFPITIAALGFGLVTVLFGVRIGRRAAVAGHGPTGVVTAAAVMAAVGAALALAAAHPAATPSLWQGVVLPAFVMALGATIGAVSETLRAERIGRADASAGPLLARWRALPEFAVAVTTAAVRVGAGTVFGVLAAAAVLVAVLIAADYATMIGLSQAIGAGVDGGIAITVAELAVLPNAVVWAASWMLGPGFAFGAGSTVSPTGTLLGPVPGVPLLGVLPPEGASLGIVWLIVPLVFAFAGANLVWRRFATTPDVRADAWWAPVILAAASGVVAGVVIGLLAWWSGGAIGPGRLAVTGPDPWPVAGIAAVTVFLGAVAGAFTARAMPRGDVGARTRPADEASAHEAHLA
ncbi:cell division protein PerM [Agromyces silvae]|uniref:cell division protein PerM n=1 Tax=Agromyces silvae TaxID=3388266 RepID=UPI00280C05E6|nr:DUF6350 family protein [Agromyces protaetiae]